MEKGPIVVNARFLLPGKLEGIGWYCHEILKRVVALLPDREFIFLFDRPYDREFIYGNNVRPIVAGPQARHPFLWYWWFEHTVPRVLEKHRAAVFFSPDGYASVSTGTPQVVTIHDLAFEHYPSHVPPLVRRYYRHFTPLFVQKADHIIAVSQATKDDITAQYSTAGSKISVLHNGCNGEFIPLSVVEKDQVRQEISGGLPYFIFVSALHPRKNVTGNLQAFDMFKKENGDTHKLLVTGRKAWGNTEMEQVYSGMQYKGDVIFSGHLDRKTLSRYLGAAEALVYPSFFEGFGLPVLEAMYCEVPVITSNISAMPEVAGDAALLVSPGDPAGIAHAMTRIVHETGLRETLIHKERTQRNLFSWDRSAEKLAERLAEY